MKKFLLMISLLFFSFNSVVFGADYVMTEELAQEILDYYKQGSSVWAGNSSYISAYGSTVQNILNNLTAENFATYFNTYMEEATFEKTGKFQNLTVLFEVIYPGAARFCFYQSNNTSPGGLELPYLNLSQVISHTSNSYTLGGTDSLIDTTLKNLNFLNLVFNSNGTVNAASGDNYFSRDLYNITFNDDDTIIYIPSLLALSKTQFLYYTPYSGQKNGYFIGNTVVGNYDPIPPDLPSGDGETVTPGDMPSGDYTAGIIAINNNIIKIHDDLVELNGKIATSGDIQQLLKENVPTSGDIANATQIGIVSGNQEFWGSSGELNGDEQEELISGKIDDLTNTLSGDLAENEIFGILQTYEDKLFGGFTGEEDFVISWNDINYNGQKLIPSGEVNFSKICRENEALGNVKSTINIILTFIILMNIVIYMYNLLLATLGIDNPYLYEKPVGSVTTSEYTDESGRTYVTRTQYDGRGNSISKRYNHTVEPKKRQIGFRKW